MLVKDIPGEAQPVVEHLEVKSVILLVGLLPGHLFVALTRLDSISEHSYCRIDAELPASPGAVRYGAMVAVPAP